MPGEEGDESHAALSRKGRYQAHGEKNHFVATLNFDPLDEKVGILTIKDRSLVIKYLTSSSRCSAWKIN